jgi:hypothetical protein
MVFGGYLLEAGGCLSQSAEGTKEIRFRHGILSALLPFLLLAVATTFRVNVTGFMEVLLREGMTTGYLLCLVLGAMVFAPSARAHHEAIFGPQSSLLYSNERFVSVQAFTRQFGTPGQRTQETTGVLSGGFNLLKGIPLAFTAIVPYSFINEVDQGSSTSGFEDSIVGVRYRYDLAGLIEKWNRDGNFILGMAGVEIPSGVIDHKAWKAPLDYLSGILGSLERGRWSGIGYVYYRYNPLYRTGGNKGDNLFLGGGIAYTPYEDT